MDLNQRFHSGTKNPNPSDRELAHGRLAREMAAEGFVLLKNEGMLPLKDDVPVALFGSGKYFCLQWIAGGRHYHYK